MKIILVLASILFVLVLCDGATTTEMSVFKFFMDNLFQPRDKIVKSGIVEPSSTGDSVEGEPAFNLVDFLTGNDKKKTTSLSRRQESNSVLRNLFRSLALSDLRGVTGDEEGDDDADDAEITTTTRRPSLLTRGANRVMGAIRSSTVRGWRNFLKSLLPSFFA